MAETFSSYDLGRADSFYRFSVKCGREMNARLEKAARAAGVSVTTFVQRHFETILDEPADDTGFSPDVFARQHGVSASAARVWRVMANQADEADAISGSARAFAAAAKVASGHSSDCLAELVEAGLVRTLVRPGGARAGTYRVVRKP